MGVFRQSAPGELEINIPGIAESTVNRINRLAAQGKKKGDSDSTDEEGKAYPKGFTPPQDYYVNPGETSDGEIPIEYGRSMILGGVYKNSENQKTKVQFSGNDVKINIENLSNAAGFQDPSKINPSTGKPVEYGDFPSLTGRESKTIKQSMNTGMDGYAFHLDYSTLQFKYLLDYYYDVNRDPTIRKIPEFSQDGNLQDNYLASYLKTNDDNEDPTMLSYDLILDVDNSPLFNGTIDKFIETFSFNSEIKSRGEILSKFKEQFFRYFKNDQPSGQNSPEFLGVSGVKTYYLKELGGLSKLNESLDSTAESKQFVNYGADFITLSLNEDVTQNIGYLAALYKNLAWSRIHGKYIIPENLLRFNLKISITEMRKFNRVFKSGTADKLFQYADLISKYEYNLYECQMFFPGLPHSDVISMSAPTMIEKFDMKFNFKFSTLKFVKFVPPSEITPGQIGESDINYDQSVIDNVKLAINSYGPGDTNSFQIRSRAGGIEPLTPKTATLANEETSLSGPTFVAGSPVSVPKQSEFKERLKLAVNKVANTIVNKVKNIAVRQINRGIIFAAQLLSRTINNILNSLPIVGGITPPKNVYEKPNIWEEAYMNFIGPGLKTFFENPIKFRSEGSIKTLDQKVSENSSIGNLGASEWSDVQFPSSAQKLPQPVTRGTKSLQELVDADTAFGNGNRLLGGIFSTNPISGNNAIPGPSIALSELVLNSSIVPSLGTFNWLDVQFPSSAQKYPPPITTG